jgi:iturin family lipopeptide synthetase A
MSNYQDVNQANGFEIAVIGMAARFPGAQNLQQFWDNLVAGRETVSFFTEEELLSGGVDKDLVAKETYIRAKGIVEGAEYFDEGFFGLTSREAALMDPQSRVLSETAYAALEDAACNPVNYKGLVGVYLGAAPNISWQQDSFCNCSDLFSEEFSTLLLNDKDFLATRLSYLLNLRGPSMSVYTACSTSLVAVDLACQSLLTGKCDTALAGAVSISLPVKAGYKYEAGMILSKDGHTKSFDQSTTGSVFSDGAGVVVLKRLADAIADGDQIHAVIKGIGINNDGSTKVGYTAPSVPGQADAIRTAYDMAEVDLESLGYIETHGSGTYIGDRIEIDALNQVFRNVSAGFNCPIGSVKSNFGHLNTAAGMAGLIKTILVLKNKMIPASLHCSNPIEKLTGNASPFYVNASLSPWTSRSVPARAGVSSFGIGGTNVHLVLEEAPPQTQRPLTEGYSVIALSARTPAVLDQLSQDMAAAFANENEMSLADAAYTLQSGRKQHAERRFVVVNNLQKASTLLSNPEAREVFSGTVKNEDRPLVMMFPGMGSGYSKMAHALYANYPGFQERVDACFDILDQLDYSGNDGVFRSGILNLDRNDKEFFLKNQINIFVFEYSLAQWLMEGGMTPSAFLGYSMGEYISACLAGVFSLQDALKILVTRGRLVSTLSQGAMLSVPMPVAQVKTFLPENLHIAIDNKFSCVVAGPYDAVMAFDEECKGRRMFTFLISDFYSLHCPLPEELVRQFRVCLSEVDFSSPSIPFLSNVTGTWSDEYEVSSPEYWVRQMTQTVLFSNNIDTLINEFTDATILEVGPGTDISLLIKRSQPAERNKNVFNIANNDDSPVAQQEYFLQRLGLLWLQGQPLDWECFQPFNKGRKISLPSYPFERNYFPAALNTAPVQKKKVVNAGGKLELENWFYLPVWQPEALEVKKGTPVEKPCIIITAEGHPLAKELEEVLGIHREVITVVPGAAFRNEGDGRYTINPKSKACYLQLFLSIQESGRGFGQIIDVRNHHAENAGIAECPAATMTRTMDELLSYTYMVQALDELKLTGTTEINMVGNGYFNVSGNDGIHTYKTPILGFLKVAPQEFPGLRCRVIDTDLSMPASHTARSVAAELENRAAGKAIALRGRTRWTQNYQPSPLPAVSGRITQLREGGNYLITGGQGNIGRAIARFLHEECGANVIISSRSGMIPREQWDAILQQGESHYDYARIKEFSSLVEDGASLHFFKADVADLASMEQLVKDVESELGQLHGVFHAAGIIDRHAFPPILTIKESDYEVQLKAKVQGTLVLQQVLKNSRPDFVLMTSSLSPILGGLGLASYASANQFLDSIANKEYASETRWISLNWADWSGWEHHVSDFLISKDAIDINISGEQGIETLRRILQYQFGHPQILISSADMEWRLNKWVLFTEENTQQDASGNVQREIKNRPQIQSEYVEPGTELEKQIVAIWENILCFDSIGVNDDFMELGGDSLKAITMLTRVRQVADINVPLEQFFKTRTIRAIASLITQPGAVEIKRLPKAEEKEFYPLSSAQRRLFFLREFDGTEVGYNETHVEILEGEVDFKKLEAAFAKVINRHDNLRARIEMSSDGPRQSIVKEVDFALEMLGSSREEDLEQVIDAFIRPFDFQEPPFLRIGITHLGGNRHALIMDRHHIISDIISTEILVREAIGFYGGMEAPELTHQYTDYVEWQISEKNSDRMKQMGEFWKNKFGGSIPVITLPTDFARPRINNFSGSVCQYRFNSDLTAKLRRLARELNITVHNVMMGLVNTWLSRLSGQDDIVVGSPVVGRNHPDLSNLIGIFINTLALRNQPTGDKRFSDFVKEINRNTIEALEHQEYQYEDLLEELNVPKNFSNNPLFDVMFVFHNQTISGIMMPGVKRTPYRFSTKKSKVDMNLVCWENDDHLDIEFEYSSSLFKASTIEEWVSYFENIARTLLEQPNLQLKEVSLLTKEQQAETLARYRGTDVNGHLHLTLQELFEEQVKQTPDHAAVVGDEKQYTYSGLNAEANQLARLLRKNSIGRGTLVGLFTSRHTSSVLGMMAIIKAGGAWLPIEPNLPAARCRYMAEDSKIGVLLVDNESIGKAAFINDMPGLLVLNIDEAQYFTGDSSNLELVNTPFDPVYAIYTSGSTGTPKGIVLKHLNAVNLVRHCVDHTKLEYDRVLQFSTISFDVSFSEIFYTLCSGGTVFLIREETRKDLPGLMKHIEKHQVSTVFLPMSLLRVIFSSVENAALMPSCIRHIQTAGEQVVVNDAFRTFLQQRGIWLHNHYGPSETHVITTLEMDPSKEIPSLPSIGLPVINTDIYIFDAYNHLLPPGIPGELCAGGAQVGLGYIGREDLNQKTFPADPYRAEGTMYRTGDIARRNKDGNIDFLGRRDGQVKIRGYRVEPGEIETALSGIPGIRQAVVKLIVDQDGEKSLCSYIVVSEDLTEEDIRQKLAQKLPEFMIPSYFIIVDKLPVTNSGKIDYAALPEPRNFKRDKIEQPGTPEEEQMRALWADVLKTDAANLGVLDNFFERGGHSLKAMQLLYKIEQHFGVKIGLPDFFRNSTIRKTTSLLSIQQSSVFPVIKEMHGSGTHPATYFQQRLFYLNMLDQSSILYNMPSAFIVEEGLDREKAVKAVREIIRRHSILRTTFDVKDKAITQHIHEQIEWAPQMLGTVNEVMDAVKEFVKPFDLKKGPLVRMGMAQLNDTGATVMLFDFHHIILDGQSIHYFMQEFSMLYNNEDPLHIPLQYKDFAHWEQSAQALEHQKKEEKYWKERLSGIDTEAAGPQRACASGRTTV